MLTHEQIAFVAMVAMSALALVAGDPVTFAILIVGAHIYNKLATLLNKVITLEREHKQPPFQK